VPAQTPDKRQPLDLRKVASTRGGSAVLAVIAAVLAGAILLVFLTQYKHSVNGDAKLTTVLVAQRLIERGSPGDLVASHGLYQTARVKKSELKDGAISDPANLKGQVALMDILPGEQLTTAEFGPSAGTIASNLAGNERAIAVPLDSAHGLIGSVQAGDRVDLIGGFNLDATGTGRAVPVDKILLQNVVVLGAPVPGGGGSGNVLLKVPADQSTNLAFAADNGKLWIVERPKVGAQNTRPTIVRLESLLLGAKPIPIQGAGGR
jgi:pilus assembly protein CpaB